MSVEDCGDRCWGGIDWRRWGTAEEATNSRDRSAWGQWRPWGGGLVEPRWRGGWLLRSRGGGVGGWGLLRSGDWEGFTGKEGSMGGKELWPHMSDSGERV